jgi:glycosyltransferase involved in cell wall biosynthesis
VTKRPLRVVSIISSLAFGGDESRTYAFARALDRTRISYSIVHLASVADEVRPEVEMMLQAYRDLGIAVTHLDGPRPLFLKRRGWSSTLSSIAAAFPMLSRLKDLVAREHVDVIDARMGTAIVIGTLVGRIHGIPVVATDYGPGAVIGPVRRLAAQVSLPAVDAFVTDSRKRLDDTREWLVRPPRRMRLIPNGIFEPSSDKTRAEMCRVLGLPSDECIVVQVARLEPRKGIVELLHAARLVLEKHPRTTFLICGISRDAAYDAAMRQKAADLGIARKVVITSYIGNIADVWKVADIVAHASLLDSSPISIHESMALGLPGVFTDTGGVPDLVEPGETALLVPAGDVAALARGLETLLGDGVLAERLGRGARRRYETYHRPEVMAAAIMDLFEEVAAERERRS